MASIKKTIFTLVFLSSFSSHAQDLDSFFFYDNKTSSTPSWVYLNDNPSEIKFEGQPLIDFISPIIKENLVINLKSKIDAQGLLKIADAKDVGLQIEFNEDTLNLDLKIDPKQLSGYDYNLNSDRSRFSNQKVLDPSPFSAIINGEILQNYNDTGNGYQTGEKTGEIESAVRFYGLVLENTFDYKSEREAIPWLRNKTKLSYDFEKALIRTSLGDIDPQLRGYMREFTGMGATIHREFSIDPEFLLNQYHSAKFFLEEPVTMEVYINDRLHRKLDIGPGPVTIGGLPLRSGLNEVKFKIIKLDGSTELIDYQQLRDYRLLEPGVVDFSLSVINPEKEPVDKWQKEYDFNKTFYQGFYRQGINNKLLLGMNFQYDDIDYLIGAEAKFLSPWGFFLMDAASTCHQERSHCGGGAKINYQNQYLDTQTRPDFNISITGEYVSKYFDLRDKLDDFINEKKFEIGAFVGQSLSQTVRTGFGLKRNYYRSDKKAENTLNLNLGVNLTKNWKFNLYYRRLMRSENDEGMFINLSWFEPQKDMQFFSNYDTFNDNANSYYRYSPKYGQHQLDAIAQWDHSKNTEASGINLDYANQRIELQAGHRSTFPTKNNDDSTIHNSFVGAGMGLAIAGGHFSLSRPIRNNFVLVDMKNRPSGQPIEINRYGKYYTSEINFLGPAVLSNLSDYQVKSIKINTSELEEGNNVNKESELIKTKYRSGHFIKFVNTISASLVGIMIDSYKQKLSLKVGYLVDAQSNQNVGEFFTDDSGLFYIEGIKSGSYYLKIYNSNLVSNKIIIKENQNGVIDLTQIQMKETKQ